MIGPLAWLLMREPLKRNVIGGTLVGFAGALFIVNTETQLLSGDVNGPVLGYLAPILASSAMPYPLSYCAFDRKVIPGRMLSSLTTYQRCTFCPFSS